MYTILVERDRNSPATRHPQRSMGPQRRFARAEIRNVSVVVSEDDVKKYVKEHLARYKVPRDVEFLDELPRNATGKVLKRELQERDA